MSTTMNQLTELVLSDPQLKTRLSGLVSSIKTDGSMTQQEMKIKFQKEFAAILKEKNIKLKPDDTELSDGDLDGVSGGVFAFNPGMSNEELKAYLAKLDEALNAGSEKCRIYVAENF